MKSFNLSLVVLSIVATTSSAFAGEHRLQTGYSYPRYSQTGAHAGQTDTDGILSPGERLNPRIDYGRAQREAERRGDYRVNNPENDRAARVADGYRYDDYGYTDNRYNNDQYWRYDRYDQGYRDQHDHSSWRYWE